jgi:hypothetical protein
MLLATVILVTVAMIPVVAEANFSGPYDVNNWTFQNTGGSTDGSVDTSGAPNSIVLTGGNSVSFSSGTTDFTIAAVAAGLVSFDWTYSSSDFGTHDVGNFLLNGSPIFLADNQSPNSAFFSIAVNQGDVFGFQVFSDDNLGGPGVLEISNFNGPGGDANGVPDSGGTLSLLALGAVGVAMLRRRALAAA